MKKIIPILLTACYMAVMTAVFGMIVYEAFRVFSIGGGIISMLILMPPLALMLSTMAEQGIIDYDND